MPEEKKLNIHQKILKIADAAGIIQRNKQAFNYKYAQEEEIQAKVTGAMQDLGVMLYEEITPGTLKILPHTYQKEKYVVVKKETKDTKAEYEKQSTTINELIVSADSVYTWVNTENPAEQVKVPWVLIGQMEDASQAFGAGATYCNRYFLMKSMQLATTEADPDGYRSKQQEAAGYGDEKEAQRAREMLDAAIKEIGDAGTELITKYGIAKETVMEVVGKYNDGNQNRSSIKTLEVCAAIMNEFEKMKKETPAPLKPKEKPAKAESKEKK